MSGGDRSWSDSTGGGTGGATHGNPCEALRRRVPLNSPDAAVVAGVQFGDRLTVRLVGAPGRQRIEAVTAAGATAGAITFDGMAPWLECLAHGVPYVAEVIERGPGAVCILDVRWAGP